MSTTALPVPQPPLPSMEETYQSVKLLMYKIAHRFADLYQVDFDELRSEADLEFVRKYPRFNPNKGMKFSSWIYFEVTTHLQNHMAKRRRRHQVEGVSLDAPIGDENGAVLADVIPQARSEAAAPSFFLDELGAVLTADAKVVVSLALDTPGELGCMLKLNQVSNWVGFQKTLREHLMELGWTRERIAESFQEISSCLCHR